MTSFILNDNIGHILSVLIFTFVLMTVNDFIRTIYLCYYFYMELASCLTFSVTDIKGKPNYNYKTIS